MKYEGIANVELASVKFTNLTGIERRCFQCGRTFVDGDSIVIFSETVFTEKSVDIGEAVRFLHVKAEDQPSSCMEEYVGRYINSLNIPKEEPSQPAIP